VRRSSARLAALLAILLAGSLLSLAACGKKGDPEPLQPDQFPRQYPAAETIPETGGTGQQPAPARPQPSPFDPLRPSYP
jgi:hypothetical protein